MGFFADLAANGKTFAPDGSVALKLKQYDVQQGAPTLPAAFAETDEVQEIAQYVENPTDGTFAITFSSRYWDSFTVSSLDHDDTAADVQTAVDSAAEAVIPDYTAGDIVVTDGDDDDASLEAGPFIIEFSGDSVKGKNHGLVVFNGSSLTGGSLAETVVTRTTAGQSDRPARAALTLLGVISDAAPNNQSEPAAVTAGSNLLRVAPWFVKEMAQECAWEDEDNSVYSLIVGSLFSQDKAPLVP